MQKWQRQERYGPTYRQRTNLEEKVEFRLVCRYVQEITHF